MKNQTPYWWWFDNHHNTKRSPWHQSTMAELDQRTLAILKLIEEDADSFAQRAEMYYKKRPQLISMIQEFYRAQRSLIERYEQLKTDSGPRHRLLTNLPPFFFSSNNQPENKFASSMELKYHAYSDTSCDVDLELEDSAESEVDDPEQPNEDLDDNEIQEGVLGTIKDVEARMLRKEMERLREENRMQKEQLKQKDEEKKEVIRQLSLTVHLLKDDNAMLRKSAANGIVFTDKRNPFDFGRFKGTFLRKLFRGSRTSQGTNVLSSFVSN